MNTAPKKLFRKFLATITVATPSLNSASAAVTVGQVDDFQDGTTQGWSNTLSMASAPTNQPNTGPGGAGDNALFSIVGGNPDAFSIVNSTQWAGDYNTAGITTIKFDANNLGINSINIGILFNGNAAGTNTVLVPVGTGWNTYSIDLTTLSFGSPTTLNSVTSLELTNSTSGVGGALDIYVDNITAVPEPHSGLLALLAFAGLFSRRRR